jgi:hypothetical protein
MQKQPLSKAALRIWAGYSLMRTHTRACNQPPWNHCIQILRGELQLHWLTHAPIHQAHLVWCEHRCNRILGGARDAPCTRSVCFVGPCRHECGGKARHGGIVGCRAVALLGDGAQLHGVKHGKG